MSQKDRIKSFLKSGRQITPLQALERFGCLRLSERIREIEREGLTVQHEWRKINGKRVMSYRLPAQGRQHDRAR